MFYRIAVSCVGTIGLLSVIGVTLLAYHEKEIPTVLNSLGSAAVGALVGLFAASR